MAKYTIKDIYAGKYDEEFLEMLGDKDEVVIPGDQVEGPDFLSNKQICIRAAREETVWSWWRGYHDDDDDGYGGTVNVPAVVWVNSFHSHILGENQADLYDSEILRIKQDMKERAERERAQLERKAAFESAYAEVQKVRKTELYKRLLPYLEEHPLRWVYHEICIDDNDTVWKTQFTDYSDPRIRRDKFLTKRDLFAEYLVYHFGPLVKKTNSPGLFTKQIWDMLHPKVSKSREELLKQFREQNFEK